MRTGFKSIKTRLTAWFLVLALLPLVIAVAVIYMLRVEVIKAGAFDKLKAIRDLKVGEVNYWLDEKIGDVRVFSRISEIENIDAVLHGKTGTRGAAKTLWTISAALNGFRESYKDYAEIFVINAKTGKIAVSTDPTREGKDVSGRRYLTEPLRTGEVYVSDIYEPGSSSRPTMEFSMPLHDFSHKEQSPCGVLVARIDLERSVYALLLNRTGLGNSGETLIVNRDGIALNELRWYSRAPLKLKIETLPVSMATQGKTGIAETTDYRGEKILAAYTQIPKTGWGFVAKMDQNEVYAPIRALLVNLLILFAVTAVIVYWVSLFLARRTAQPILAIAAVAKRIREGDLSARNLISSEDEVGFLAESFNHAAESVAFRIETEKKNTDIAETLILPKEVKEFAGAVLGKFMEITESQLGAFYLRRAGENRFEPLAAIGVNAELLETFDAAIFEGEFGKALATGKTSHIRNIPEETLFKFKTFAGTAIPREMIALPVVVKNEARAMICLASLGGYSKAALTILGQPAIIALNTAFANLLANDETRRLAGELREINQELQLQQEELEAQAEELRKQSEELQGQNVELERQRLVVEQASRMKSQFLSNMSHELRTPLNSVMALSRVLMMQAGTKLSAEELNYLDIIERNGKNLLALINDILDLSKVEAGRMDVNPKPFSLRLTLENVVESIAPLAGEKQIEIYREIPDDLPPLESDEIRVSQILQNLVANAVKFTDAGNVTVSVISDPEKVSVRIADTGIGIAENDLPYIFDEFRQVDGTAARRHEGTGLGLAIARKAARMLGGEIAVQSAPGVGSTFTLTLPVAWQGTAPVCEPMVLRQPAGVKPVRKTVLVVDDEPEMAAMISRYLLQEGYNTLTATSGSEALKLAARARPFAVTLDIIMPDMDGWEVLQGLKKNPETKEIPVIVVSISEDRGTGFALGAIGYVTKPVSKKRLISEIEKIGKPGPRSIMINDLDLENLSQHPGLGKPASPPRILLVEDNEAAIIQVKAVLESAGYVADVARGGKEAFDYVSRTIPDGIVLDLMMPEIDGFHVLEKIRGAKATATIPILILTAKDLTPEDFRKLSANHIQQFVQKGDIDRDSLLSKIRSMLGTGSGPRARRYDGTAE